MGTRVECYPIFQGVLVLGLIITNTINKFQSLGHKTLLLILDRFSGKMPLRATSVDTYVSADAKDVYSFSLFFIPQIK